MKLRARRLLAGEATSTRPTIEPEKQFGAGTMFGDGNESEARQYCVMKEEIDRRFSPGTFVAIESGKVVADAVSHRKLVEQLKLQGKSPNGMFIVQAGVNYPDSAVIFVASTKHRRHA